MMVRYEGRLAIPEGYSAKMDIRTTEIAIKTIKDRFEAELADTLNLTRVSAPLYVRPETGLNDDLNGVERPVNFDIKDMAAHVQVVQSLAKWKRMALHRYGFRHGEGIYTDMNAIRRDEDLDNLHSVYVDQWDWEKVVAREERTSETLRSVVLEIYRCFQRLENHLLRLFPELDRKLPDSLFFVTSQELEDRWPDVSPREREDRICREKRAVFVQNIGGPLRSGVRHDGRAPDYDDWNLNGDILFWYPLLDRAFEISSMGIRVDAASLSAQLEATGCGKRAHMEFHQGVLHDVLPLSIGGGIGQSRLCMFFLDKAHIGEVQSSVWPEAMMERCAELGMRLL